MNNFDLENIKRKTLKDTIYETLKVKIMQNEFPSDYYVTEQENANKLNVSRTPLREAMMALRNEELIEFIPRKGYKTKTYSDIDIHQIFILRKMIEQKVVAPLLEIISLEEIEEFKEIVNKQQRLKEEESQEFMNLDKEFHRKMFLIPKYDVFLRAYDVFHNLTVLIGSEVIQKKGRMEEVIKEHNKIIQGFEKKDKVLTKKAISNHLQNTENIYINMKEYK